MNTPNPERRVRPVVVVLVACVVAALMIPLWVFVLKPAPPPPAPEPAEAAAPAPSVQPVVKPQIVTRVRPSRRARPAPQVKVEAPAPAPPMPGIEEQWGIQLCGLRLSMMNSIVDLRYKVIDPEKAVLLANGRTPAYIVDPATGTKLIMPTPPKEGAFPPTANRLAAGKTYFAMVSNQRGLLKSGSVVSVVVGGSQATNLTVQ